MIISLRQYYYFMYNYMHIKTGGPKRLVCTQHKYYSSILITITHQYSTSQLIFLFAVATATIRKSICLFDCAQLNKQVHSIDGLLRHHSMSP